MEKMKMTITVILLIIFAAAIMTIPTKLLWNGCLVPAVDGINNIGYNQAFGLNFLFTILFKSAKINK
jgi:hypothetical protein